MNNILEKEVVACYYGGILEHSTDETRLFNFNKETQRFELVTARYLSLSVEEVIGEKNFAVMRIHPENASVSDTAIKYDKDDFTRDYNINTEKVIKTIDFVKGDW